MKAVKIIEDYKGELRVLFLGMRGVFSQQVLSVLLQAGAFVCGVLVPSVSATAVDKNIAIRQLTEPKNSSPLPLLTPFAKTDIVTIAWANNIPVYEVDNLKAPATSEVIKNLQPDVACVACFNKRVPASLLPLPPFGFWNVHPSLLPAYRGPAPLFWILRAGGAETGVTVHQMDESLDSGNILAQQALSLPDGLSGPDADQLLARKGAELLIENLQSAAYGTLNSQPQPPGGSSFSWPKAPDFHIPNSWSARRAFNFMCGTAEWQMPFTIEVDQQRITARTALAFDPDGILTRPVVGNGRNLQIQFNPGTLTVSKW